MSMCRIFSCVVGRGCLLWPVCSLGKTLLAFTLLHSVPQGQICLLLQVCLDFLLLPDSQYQNQMDYILYCWRWRSSIQSAKTSLGADSGSDHELLIAKFRLKLKKVGKTTRPFRYDLNQIPYAYTVEVTNRSKGLDVIECLKNYGRRFVTLYRRQWSRPSPRKRNAKRQNGCLRRPCK